jgi:hypothetical protein
MPARCPLQAQLIVKLSNLLHKRVLSTILLDSSRDDLDDLLLVSDDLCSCTDDFVASLDSPQELYDVKAAVDKVEGVLIPFRDKLRAITQKKEVIWLATFEKQFQQAIDSLQSLLHPKSQITGKNTVLS